MGDIKYNYPVEKLDQLWHMIYDEGITPMITPDLQTEVELRYQDFGTVLREHLQAPYQNAQDLLLRHGAALPLARFKRRCRPGGKPLCRGGVRGLRDFGGA